MIKLHKSLCDVTLVPVETRSRRRMFMVDINGVRHGMIEKFPAAEGEVHPWKAFQGIGIRCQYVEAFYAEDGGINAAVACVLGRKMNAKGRYELA
jgi:hypothetical protein